MITEMLQKIKQKRSQRAQLKENAQLRDFYKYDSEIEFVNQVPSQKALSGGDNKDVASFDLRMNESLPMPIDQSPTRVQQTDKRKVEERKSVDLNYEETRIAANALAQTGGGTRSRTRD